MEALYHVWFSTKGRKPVLDGDIGEEAKRLLAETAERTGIELIEVEALADHVHLLVAVTMERTLPAVMHQLKGTSARLIFLKYPELKLDLRHNSLWQKGYGWRRVAATDVPGVRNYIRSQQGRDLRHNT